MRSLHVAQGSTALQTKDGLADQAGSGALPTSRHDTNNKSAGQEKKKKRKHSFESIFSIGK